jgi:hypothetical protein
MVYFSKSPKAVIAFLLNTSFALQEIVPVGSFLRGETGRVRGYLRAALSSTPFSELPAVLATSCVINNEKNLGLARKPRHHQSTEIGWFYSAFIVFQTLP